MEEDSKIHFELPQDGSLGMLALGARGYLSWKKREFVAFPPSGKKPKWLILGWDAADWDVILPMMQRGALPTLSRFLAEGAHGRLATLNPPLSPMLWTSVATGRRAYEHGILGFTESDPETGNLRAVRGSSRRTRAFWNILEDHGHTANVLGWWPSHPAEKLKGAMVSNFFQIIPEKGKEGLNVESVQPEFIRPEMDSLRMHPSEVTSTMLAPFFPEAPGLDSKEDGKVRSVMKILSQAVSIHNTSTWLLENRPSEIQAVYFDAIDHLCHLAMAYHPPKQKHVDPDDFRKYHFIVEAGYRFHDMMLERYLDLTQGETNILILSDHGFRSGNHRLSSLPEHPGAPALDHTPYGMIAAMGPDIKPGEIHGASLLDIFPTILQAFDLPLPEDIPGRSLQELFRTGKKGGSVPTYEKTPLSLPTDKGGVDQEVLKQLADIGYLDPDQVPMGRSGEITPENRVNLARSLADAGKWKEAISEMKTACSILPNSSWILEELGMIAWQAGNVAELEETIKRLQELAPDSRWLIFFKGVHSMILGRPIIAREYLGALPRDPMVDKIIARAWISEGGFESAALILDSLAEDDEVCFLKGCIHFERGQWEEALDQLLRSTGFRFVQPDAHYLLSRTFHHLGMFDESHKAIEVALKYRPGRADLLEWKRSITPEKTKDPEKLPLIWVVTGLPRSGTSLMMQILDNSGIPVLSDGQRKADPFNPDGYFELESIKELPYTSQMIEEAEGKALKIVVPLIRFIPPKAHYKVIFMNREISEVIRSQDRLKGESRTEFPLDLAMQLENERERTRKWLDDQPHIKWIEVSYERLKNRGEKQIQDIQDFLGIKHSTKWMSIIRSE